MISGGKTRMEVHTAATFKSACQPATHTWCMVFDMRYATRFCLLDVFAHILEQALGEHPGQMTIDFSNPGFVPRYNPCEVFKGDQVLATTSDLPSSARRLKERSRVFRSGHAYNGDMEAIEFSCRYRASKCGSPERSCGALPIAQHRDSAEHRQQSRGHQYPGQVGSHWTTGWLVQGC